MKINIISTYEVQVPDNWNFDQICSYVEQEFDFHKECRINFAWSEDSIALMEENINAQNHSQCNGCRRVYSSL